MTSLKKQLAELDLAISTLEEKRTEIVNRMDASLNPTLRSAGPGKLITFPVKRSERTGAGFAL